MEEQVVGADDQALQTMLTDAQWNSRAVMDQVAQEADQLLGGSEESDLLIDESSVAEKGEHSVGVARQWRGPSRRGQDTTTSSPGTAANQLWSWDITYLVSTVKSKFFYFYLIMDVYSLNCGPGSRWHCVCGICSLGIPQDPST